MSTNIQIAKVSASPTSHAWSQAYSTVNFYIVLSIKSKGEEEILNVGKELLEKIQREYFSLDDKNLKTIKSSVEASVENFGQNHEVALILATLKENTLYIVTAGESNAILKRGEKIGSIAKGDENQVIAFSGKLSPGDKVVFQTSDFSNKVSIDNLSRILSENDTSDISEELTPLIHEKSIGTEAALVIEYEPFEQDELQSTGLGNEEEHQELEQKNSEEENNKSNPKDDGDEDNVLQVHKKPFSLPIISALKIPDFKSFGKRKLIILAIVIMLVVLLASVFFERQRQENARLESALEEILSPAQEQFDEAISLLELNQALAFEEFEEIKENLEQARGDFSEGSSQLVRLDAFIGRVEEEIGKLTEGTSVTNQQEIFDNSKLVIFREGNLISVSENGILNILGVDGSLEDEIETDNDNVISITASGSSVYIMGDSGITRTTISNGNTTSAVEDLDETVAIDLFGSNVYGLNVDNNSIDRYSGASFTQGDYLNEDEELANPTSMAIDGSIWVIDGGEIRQFSRGSDEGFSASGLSISNNSIIFTSVDYDNLYVVDRSAAKVYIVSKNGDIENQYSWAMLSNADSISADEENGVIYITASSKLYSFEF